MAKLILLGTAAAIPDLGNENTHMLLLGEERKVLIDTASNPVVQLQKVGVEITSLTDIILTHFHPDHVSGAPLLLLDSWLLGRKQPLNIHGLGVTIERFEKMMDLYDWQEWPGFFPINLHRLAVEEGTQVLDCAEFTIRASQGCHMIPATGLRIDFPTAGETLAYSCDTAPCQEIVRLAQGADILIHEATGADFGHSSAAQAGEIAQQANAGKLVLVHYDPDTDREGLIQAAKSQFTGEVIAGEPFMEFNFSTTSR